MNWRPISRGSLFVLAVAAAVATALAAPALADYKGAGGTANGMSTEVRTHYSISSCEGLSFWKVTKTEVKVTDVSSSYWFKYYNGKMGQGGMGCGDILPSSQSKAFSLSTGSAVYTNGTNGWKSHTSGFSKYYFPLTLGGITPALGTWVNIQSTRSSSGVGTYVKCYTVTVAGANPVCSSSY